MTRILITSALPYINGAKHLGNLVGSLLPADVHARFRRQVGDDVLFICGTRTALNLVRLSAVLAWSVIPTLSETVLRAFDDKRQIPSWPEPSAAELLDGDAGRKVELLDVLVDKITDDRVARLQGLFGGLAAA